MRGWTRNPMPRGFWCEAGNPCYFLVKRPMQCQTMVTWLPIDLRGWTRVCKVDPPSNSRGYPNCCLGPSIDCWLSKSTFESSFQLWILLFYIQLWFLLLIFSSPLNIKKSRLDFVFLQILYRRATRTRKNAFRYNLRLRMSVANGLKMMLHHYSTNKQVNLHSWFL